MVEVSSTSSSTSEALNSEEGDDTNKVDGDDVSDREDVARDALTEEQRRLEELEKAEHEAEMARLKKCVRSTNTQTERCLIFVWNNSLFLNEIFANGVFMRA